MEKDAWTVAWRASGMVNARIVAGRLEAEGIPTRLKYEAAGVVYAITIDGLGEVQILVPHECVEEARRVLEQTFEEGNIDWEEPED